MISPNANWENRFGFIREVVDATTGQPITPADVNLNLLGSNFFPGITIENADAGAPLAGGGKVEALFGNSQKIGPSTNFANAGIVQNEFEGSSIYHWVTGKHSLAFGALYDYEQLNVQNRENEVATFTFGDFRRVSSPETWEVLVTARANFSTARLTATSALAPPVCLRRTATGFALTSPSPPDCGGIGMARYTRPTACSPTSIHPTMPTILNTDSFGTLPKRRTGNRPRSGGQQQSLRI